MATKFVFKIGTIEQYIFLHVVLHHHLMPLDVFVILLTPKEHFFVSLSQTETLSFRIKKNENLEQESVLVYYVNNFVVMKIVSEEVTEQDRKVQLNVDDELQFFEVKNVKFV